MDNPLWHFTFLSTGEIELGLKVGLHDAIPQRPLKFVVGRWLAAVQLRADVHRKGSSMSPMSVEGRVEAL